VALVAGLFIVFKFVVQPKAGQVVTAPRPVAGAPQTAAPSALGTTLGGIAALVMAAGPTWTAIFGAGGSE
jgi:hypothetical protein